MISGNKIVGLATACNTLGAFQNELQLRRSYSSGGRFSCVLRRCCRSSRQQPKGRDCCRMTTSSPRSWRHIDHIGRWAGRAGVLGSQYCRYVHRSVSLWRHKSVQDHPGDDGLPQNEPHRALSAFRRDTAR